VVHLMVELRLSVGSGSSVILASCTVHHNFSDKLAPEHRGSV